MQPFAEESASATSPRSVAVLGPGGVGGLLAALLARAGHRVICLATEPTVQALREKGIRVRSQQFGEFTARVEADTVLREPVDVCLVTVKHSVLGEALDRVAAQHLGNGVVVPLLNGIEHLEELRARFGDRTVPAVIRVESTRTAPGVIEHGSPFVEIDLAGPDERLTALAALLTSIGVSTRVLPDEAAVLWAKLAFLAPFALLTTRYRTPIGTIRSQRRSELLALVEETTAVANAAGATIDAAQILSRYDAFLPGSKSSMLRDAEAGRVLELDAIGGAVLRAAERHGIDAPITTRLVDVLATHQQIEQLLRDRGADLIPHPGGTLFTHLNRVTELLAAWGADEDVQYAGLCHAMYGTDGFNKSLLDLPERHILRALIGERAEALVYLYGSCDRSAVYPRLDRMPVLFRDRFKDIEFEPADLELTAFMEITAANELDVMVHNAELAAQHGSALYELFGRCAHLLSTAAWQAWEKEFGPVETGSHSTA